MCGPRGFSPRFDANIGHHVATRGHADYHISVSVESVSETGNLGKCASVGRAGFAQQGYRQKRMLKDHRAFDVPSFVLRSMMNGQYWPEGDEVYHAEIVVPTLLVHGMHDRFVHVDDDQQMTEAS